MIIEEEVEFHKETCKKLTLLFETKRHDYGQTTTDSWKKFGPVSILVRMGDKLGRLETLLVQNKSEPHHEKIEDTLLDLANYAIIALCNGVV